MSDRGVLLIVAVSARALAEAARRADYRTVAIDAFGDQDLLSACQEWIAAPNAAEGFAKVDLDAILPSKDAQKLTGIVYGTGFDDCPRQLRRLASHAPLLGASPESVACANEPLLLAGLCAAAGLRHPDIEFESPSRPDAWVLKRKGGWGGTHVREGGAAPAPGDYWQRRVAGRSVSLLFTRDAEALTPLAWSEQWTDPCASAPYRYGGAAGPIDCRAERELLPALAELTQEMGLRGLASADFIDDGEDFWLVEINPRPGATLDVFDDEADPLLLRHLDAVAGRPARTPQARSAKAVAVAYAEEDLTVPQATWPEWVADRPTPGAAIPRQAPICTVSARAATADEARRKLSERVRRAQEIVKGIAA